MEFKVPPIDIPADDPFRFDALGRKASIEALTTLVTDLKGPFTLAIDSRWGTGKTTFIKMWKMYLESQGLTCAYFDAWSTDFSSDPLVAFLGEVDALLRKNKPKAKHANLTKARKIATILAKRVLPTAGKIATAGLVDLDDFTEKALAELSADTIKDAVDAYTAEKDLIVQFRETLSKAIGDLHEEGSKGPLVVFVDEIDRCKPTFAVELLERIKHLFNVENAIFVLALDKSQLSVSLKAIYGDGMDTEEYLRRFVDLEFLLPDADQNAYVKDLFKRFGFDEFFKARTHHDLRSDADYLARGVVALSRLYRLTLRAQEQCLTRVRVAMMTTPVDHYLYPFLLAPLVILKAGAPTIYKNYAMGDGAASDVVEHWRSLPGGAEFLDSHEGAVVEAHLILAKAERWQYEEDPLFRKYQAIAADEKAQPMAKARAEKVVSIISNMNIRSSTPSLKYVVGRVELAARFAA